MPWIIFEVAEDPRWHGYAVKRTHGHLKLVSLFHSGTIPFTRGLFDTSPPGNVLQRAGPSCQARRLRAFGLLSAFGLAGPPFPVLELDTLK
jgi:hypothetical protein